MLETRNIRLPSCFPPHCTQHSRGSSSLQSSSPAPSPPDDDDDDNDDGNGPGAGGGAAGPAGAHPAQPQRGSGQEEQQLPPGAGDRGPEAEVGNTKFHIYHF